VWTDPGVYNIFKGDNTLLFPLYVDDKKDPSRAIYIYSYVDERNREIKHWR
jgi:hypothetical protein